MPSVCTKILPMPKPKPFYICAGCGAEIPNDGRSAKKYCSLTCAVSSRLSKTSAPPCWLFMGSRMKTGYGRYAAKRGITIPTHRIMFEAYYGPIPKGLYVLHRCDNPPCCRPDHLFLGTLSDNTKDMMAKGRHKPTWVPGSKHGRAKLNEEQVISIRKRKAAGERRQNLAAEYGVSIKTINGIIYRERWRHI